MGGLFLGANAKTGAWAAAKRGASGACCVLVFAGCGSETGQARQRVEVVAEPDAGGSSVASGSFGGAGAAPLDAGAPADAGFELPPEHQPGGFCEGRNHPDIGYTAFVEVIEERSDLYAQRYCLWRCDPDNPITDPADPRSCSTVQGCVRLGATYTWTVGPDNYADCVGTGGDYYCAPVDWHQRGIDGEAPPACQYDDSSLIYED